MLDQLETHDRIVHKEKLDLKVNCCQGTHKIHWNEGRLFSHAWSSVQAANVEIARK